MDHSVLPNARLLVNEGNSREWAETLKEMQNRSRYSSHNLLLSLPKDDDDTDNFSPLQSQPSIRKLQTADPKMSKSARSVTNLPKPNSLPYTWKRSDEDYSLVKQATDRSYKHTYAVKQKPLISNSQRSDTNMKQTAKSASFVLPSKVAAKIYTNLHKNSQRGKYVYVIKNMRKTTPAKKSVNLPFSNTFIQHSTCQVSEHSFNRRNVSE
ncbi:hypothetical protein EB796_016079 [Bugula neritina]|uniref:Uncharacterized protein n=1 Tax=Bugula neritina TaxID=10212 RepID=A0A7J7JIY4_BUGNE|nr:hypothetical protein EB796_016079 [Bugula neritina]